MRDFTLTMYWRLLEAAKPRGVYTVRDYLLEKPSGGVILRHDVDVSAEKALRMAELEHNLGVHSTYYFRYPKTFNPEIMKKIETMGHEVGYHYEVLDKTKGDVDEAMKLFQQELSEFREHVRVDTVAMHGSVLSKHDNKTIWNTHELSDFSLLGEAYLSLTEIPYFTDTGRDWTNKYSIKDKAAKTPDVNSTAELIESIRTRKQPLTCVNTHPKRWSDNHIEWMWELVYQSIKNIIKFMMNLR